MATLLWKLILPHLGGPMLLKWSIIFAILSRLWLFGYGSFRDLFIYLLKDFIDGDLFTCSVHISPFTELFNRFCMYTKGDFFLYHSLLYLHDIQRCAEDFLLDEGALETESPVRPSDISAWAWLGSGQWVVWHRRRVWAGSRNLASSDSNSKRAPYTH